MADEHDALAHKADAVRNRLVVTLSSLDERRRALTDVRAQVRRHPGVLVAAFGLVVVGLGGTLAISAWHASAVRRRRRTERWHALRRFWFHPELLARDKPPEGSLLQRVGASIVISALTYAASTIAKKGVRRLVHLREQRLESRRLEQGGRGAVAVTTIEARD